MTDFCLILTTVPDERTAKALARSLVEKRLAACVTTSPPVDSIYWWEEKITEDREFVLMIKTRSGLFGAVEAGIREIHPYRVPEVIALPITEGAGSYLDWLFRETGGPDRNR